MVECYWTNLDLPGRQRMNDSHLTADSTRPTCGPASSGGHTSRLLDARQVVEEWEGKGMALIIFEEDLLGDYGYNEYAQVVAITAAKKI
ncbi:hypothetical protein RRG08_012679 [Elysia crispata]|uniref:Uncharacterized protein n=1 Tax=Elysia crispata TaxID=231223 RepID=A0AAE1D1K8_9GAST|nr:hypothetical protein RRG08_012679 [Elysia crispata]